MEARALLKMDESRYGNLRFQAALESPGYLTQALHHELAQFEQTGCSVLADYAAQGTRVWGVFDTSSLVGVVAVSSLWTHAPHDAFWLWGLYVLPRFRGTSASRYLMRATQEWVDDQAFGAPILGAYHRNNRRARQLVERFGFVESDLRSDVARAGLLAPEDVLVEYRHRAFARRA